jgi:hypothetical protein
VCGNTCAQRSACERGACICWDNRTTLCEAGCFDLDNDPSNCGACGNDCPSAEGGVAACVRGVCQNPCEEGFALGEVCGGACVDLADDTNNCGQCGVGCEGLFEGVPGRDCVDGTSASCSSQLEGCTAGTCQLRVNYSWQRGAGGGAVSCGQVCENLGLACATVRLDECPNDNDEWQGIDFDGREGAGCAIFSSGNGWGPDLLGCDDFVDEDNGGPYYMDRRLMRCWCEPAGEPIDPAEVIMAPGDYPRPGFGQNQSDQIPLRLDAQRVVTIRTGDGANGCPADTILAVRQGQQVLAEDDDAGNDVCSLVQLDLPAGDYIIVVSGYSGGAVPLYVLTVDW